MTRFRIFYPNKAQAVLEQLKEVSVGDQTASKQEQSPNGNNSNKTEDESSIIGFGPTL